MRLAVCLIWNHRNLLLSSDVLNVRVDELSEALQKRGYSADGLHGDLSQNQRDNVMRKFRDGSIDVLVATDVAARGLDVSGVTHVIDFDLPQDPESYVHRIGRTGRAGKKEQLGHSSLHVRLITCTSSKKLHVKKLLRNHCQALLKQLKASNV